MTLGLRPEHLTETRENPRPGVQPFDVRVGVVEPMGMETMVHFLIGRDPMCARIDPSARAVPNEPMRLHADMNNMHLIEPETGQVI